MKMVVGDLITVVITVGSGKEKFHFCVPIGVNTMYSKVKFRMELFDKKLKPQDHRKCGRITYKKIGILHNFYISLLSKLKTV